MRDYRPISRLLIIIVTTSVGFSLCSCSPGASPVGGATLGAALQVNLNKAQQLISDAQAAGNAVLLSAAVQLQNTITSAQLAYESSLDKSKDALDDSTRKALTDIDDLTDKLVKQGAQAANDILARSQLIANSLPFSNKRPQLADFSPKYLYAGVGQHNLHFSGNFPFASDGHKLPELEINGKRLKAATFTTLGIDVTIPADALDKPKADSVSPMQAKLHIPYEKGGFGGGVGDGVFPCSVAMLPVSPGKLAITHTVSSSHREESTRQSATFNFDSHADDIEDNRELHLGEEDIRNGWRIVPNSGSFVMVQHVEGSEGHDWYNKGMQSQSDVSIVWRARTEHKGLGSSGKIKWAIACKVYRNVNTTTQQPEQIPLAWGMQKVFAYPAGKWKAVWTRFDGVTRDIVSTDRENTFLQVSATGDSFTVRTFGQ